MSADLTQQKQARRPVHEDAIRCLRHKVGRCPAQRSLHSIKVGAVAASAQQLISVDCVRKRGAHGIGARVPVARVFEPSCTRCIYHARFATASGWCKSNVIDCWGPNA